MKQLLRSGRSVGFLLGVSLFVLAPLTVGAFWDGFPFGRGGTPAPIVNPGKFPGKLCASSVTAAGISVPVYLPCKKDTPPPPPVDVCPNVPGVQTSGPCADDVCEDEGGVWDGNSCEMPAEPEPTLEFSASPLSISAGATSTLSWDSTDADTCTASNGWSGSRAVDGSQIVSPTATTTYTLTCENDEGEVSKSVTVAVTPVMPEPEEPALVFTSALSTILEGATTTLTWDSSNADTCMASNGWSGSKPVDGSEVVGPTATTTYTLTCEGEGGMVAGSVVVAVMVAPSEPEPEGKLLITEVMYDLTTSTSTPQGIEPANEWVEIYNGTNSTIHLADFSIADASSTDALPDIELPAGAFAVIVASSTTADFWSIPNTAVIVQLTNATIGNGLGNGGDMVALVHNAASTTVDAVSWGSNTTAFSPSVTGVVAGHSIARTDIEVDTDSAADWEDRQTPTPGQ